MSNLQRFQNKARELGGSGKFHGWRPLAFEMQFQDGFEEAREWLLRSETREELDSTNSARLRRDLQKQTPLLQGIAEAAAAKSTSV